MKLLREVELVLEPSTSTTADPEDWAKSCSPGKYQQRAEQPKDVLPELASRQ